MPRNCLGALLAALTLVAMSGCAVGGPGDTQGDTRGEEQRSTATAETPTVTPTGTPTAVPTIDVAATDLEEYAAELLAETNRVRQEEGLETLAHSECAQNAAVERAAALVGKELEHAPLGPVIDACPPHTMAAENLVDSNATPTAVVEAWLGSPGHRNNLLAPDVTEIGIGCVEDDDQLLCAQIFLGP